jgi:two-component system, OmpR family, sensor histidine kinase KdpD
MRSRLPLVTRVSVSIGAVAAMTTVYGQFVRVNPTTVALSYVLAVLVTATSWGIVEATAASLTAVLCFNFFSLPPVGKWTIADPQNWVALVVLMITAIIASQLSGRARRRTIDAVGRQRDLERLYALSRALLLSDTDSSFPRVIAQRIAESFELDAVALYDQHADQVFWGGHRDRPHIEYRMREVARQSVSIRDVDGMVVTAIRLGAAPIGSLALNDTGLSDTVLQSVANLAAIGLERARANRATARAEAARQSGELRATVLDALAHEFKTPLTSMKAASSDLVGAALPTDRDRELVAIIDEGLDRLQRLVSDAVQMLRIDSGTFAVHHQRHAVANLVQSTLHGFAPRLDGHQVVNLVPEQLLVDADPELLALALRQLLDNAVKYSPPTSTIELRVISNDMLEISVRNSGPPIPKPEQDRIFERFYRGGQARHVAGSGMGLAIVQQIAQAHEGSVSVRSNAATGTEFTLTLPRGGGA